MPHCLRLLVACSLHWLMVSLNPRLRFAPGSVRFPSPGLELVAYQMDPHAAHLSPVARVLSVQPCPGWSDPRAMVTRDWFGYVAQAWGVGAQTAFAPAGMGCMMRKGWPSSSDLKASHSICCISDAAVLKAAGPSESRPPWIRALAASTRLDKRCDGQ